MDHALCDLAQFRSFASVFLVSVSLSLRSAASVVVLDRAVACLSGWIAHTQQETPAREQARFLRNFARPKTYYIEKRARSFKYRKIYSI